MAEDISIFNKDCLEVLKTIPDKSIDLVVTDPPYVLDMNGGGGFLKEIPVYVNNELNEMEDGFSEVVLDEICRVMKKINCYFFCSRLQIPILINYFGKKNNTKWSILCWHKTNPLPTCNNKYLSDTEFILFFKEKGVKLYGTFDTKRTWYATPVNQKDKKLYNHPTVKPLFIVENLIKNSSTENELVLDPFMGTGTTGVACKNIKRKFIGCEIKEEYFKTAERRINEITLI